MTDPEPLTDDSVRRREDARIEAAEIDARALLKLNNTLLERVAELEAENARLQQAEANANGHSDSLRRHAKRQQAALRQCGEAFGKTIEESVQGQNRLHGIKHGGPGRETFALIEKWSRAARALPAVKEAMEK